MVGFEFLDRLPSGTGWTIAVVFIVLVFGPVGIFSRESAQKLWIIGRAIRWVQDRQKRAIAAEAELESIRAKRIQDQVSSLRDSLEQDRVWYNAELENLRNDLSHEREQRKKSEHEFRYIISRWQSYAMYVSQWATNVLNMHRKYGWEPPITPQMSFDEWIEKETKNDDTGI